MPTPVNRPSVGRRLAVILSIVLVVAVAIATVVLAFDRVGPLVAVLALDAVVVLLGWYALTRGDGSTVGNDARNRRGRRRRRGRGFRVGGVVAGVAARGFGGRNRARPVRAFVRRAHPQEQRDDGTPVPAAEHGVLIMNLKSGGGKAERFHLVDECRLRGIEPVVPQSGDDLLDLARDAIGRGADVIGMAGGDGSQALVASIAAERGIPMVVIPAGTRNHLALDLGIDRDDVVGALDAFGAAVERPMDLAEVNGHVFVNNVSLGLYGAIVQSPDYRDAKVDTTLSALPRPLGPGSQPMDLRFEGPDGTCDDGAHVVQVSNGPYGTTLATMTRRPRIDTGALGITTLVLPDAAATRRFLAALGDQPARPVRGPPGLVGWRVRHRVRRRGGGRARR